jgi:hypothetical protein
MDEGKRAAAREFVDNGAPEIKSGNVWSVL